jgi:hypothetical protein
VARKRPLPPGVSWRILAYGPRGAPRFALHSLDYPDPEPRLRKYGINPYPKQERVPFRTVLDEVVICGSVGRGGDVIHLEQMDTRTWYLGIGEQKVMVTFDRKGKVTMGEWYR